MCAANINDKWRKYKSRFSTTLSTTIGTGVSDTLTPATVTGLPTDTAITLMIDRVDSTGARTPTKLELIKGIVSGGNLTSYVRAVEGTEQQHTGGAVIEMVWNAADWNDAVDSFLAGHTQAGAHVSALPLTSPVLTTPKVVTSINDANGNEVIKTPATTSAVNEVTVTNSATGNAVQVSATGDDTNIDLKLVPKGTGAILDKNGEALSPNSSMARQAIMNGGMRVAQRGTSVTVALGANQFLIDRFKTFADAGGGTAPSLTQSQATLTPGDIPYLYNYWNLATNGAGTSLGASSQFIFYQTIEHGTRSLCGLNKKVNFSFWAKSDIANKKLGIALLQHYGTGGTPSSAETIQGSTITLTSTWTRYTFTLTTNTLVGKTFGTANDDSIWAMIYPQWGATIGTNNGFGAAETYVGAGNIGITGVQLCAGDVALPFQPKSFEEELRACMRYYEKSYPYSVVPGTATNAGQNYAKSFYDAGSIAPYDGGRYRVEKRAIPTLVIYNPYAGTANQVRNEADGSTVGSPWTTPNNNTSSMGVIVKAASFSTTGTYAFQFTADAEL